MALSIIVDHCYVEGCYAVTNSESPIKAPYAGCRYAKCHYAKCNYAKCNNAKCNYAKCNYAKCNNAKCNYAKCNYAKCKYAKCRGAVVCPNHKQKSRVCQIFEFAELKKKLT